jgi:hypothetical protein
MKRKLILQHTSGEKLEVHSIAAFAKEFGFTINDAYKLCCFDIEELGGWKLFFKEEKFTVDHSIITTLFSRK